jgi:hypothetical protein
MANELDHFGFSRITPVKEGGMVGRRRTRKITRQATLWSWSIRKVLYFVYSLDLTPYIIKEEHTIVKAPTRSHDAIHLQQLQATLK